MNANGRIVWQGPSLLDGEPLVVIVTGLTRKSKNTKTANELQTYVMRADVEPHIAKRDGLDFSVCGNCFHRLHSTCYVQVQNAPLAVYRCFAKGRYATLSQADVPLFVGRTLRIGSFGDPAAVPIEVWDTLTGLCHHWTGYTHQWRHCEPGLKAYAMASVESLDGQVDAAMAGWRTFRAMLPGDNEPTQGNEFKCPAQTKGMTCEECVACSGTTSRMARSATIEAHGSRSGMARLAKVAKARRDGTLDTLRKWTPKPTLLER